ncbi:MAG: TonB-dependent receptor plug domain-containing protein, partial [Saprospiraceae bacterium]
MIKSILTFTLLWSSIFLFGQRSISGTVTEVDSDEPLIGVSINEKGTANGTITDFTGNFSLEVTENAELIFSYIGYESQTITPTSNYLTIALAESATQLDEVVITALGIEREKKALGYAVQELDGEQISKVRSSNLVNGLSGKIAGVQINNGSSGVGSSSRIVIRGEASLTGRNEALFVVDGVPISNELILNNTENDATGFQEVDYGNGAAEISPDDIESISVLKGPAATALYGSRAASGVVVITTKKGEKSKGIGVSINSSATFENPLRLPQYQ